MLSINQTKNKQSKVEKKLTSHSNRVIIIWSLMLTGHSQWKVDIIKVYPLSIARNFTNSFFFCGESQTRERTGGWLYLNGDLDREFTAVCPEWRLSCFAYYMLITLHDVMCVLLCRLIKGAAVQNTAGLIEGDT